MKQSTSLQAAETWGVALSTWLTALLVGARGGREEGREKDSVAAFSDRGPGDTALLLSSGQIDHSPVTWGNHSFCSVPWS